MGVRSGPPPASSAFATPPIWEAQGLPAEAFAESCPSAPDSASLKFGDRPPIWLSRFPSRPDVAAHGVVACCVACCDPCCDACRVAWDCDDVVLVSLVLLPMITDPSQALFVSPGMRGERAPSPDGR